MEVPTGQDSESELGWGVGSVAARLGISASTLRTWERRYDVGPSRRTAGGHRRYSEADIDRVVLTQLLIARGAPPSDAARVAHSLDDAGLAHALDGEHAQSERESGRPGEVVPAIVQAAVDGDPQRIGRLVTDSLRGLGAVGAWTEIIAPTLIEIGQQWSAGHLGIEAEHLASEAIVGELRAYTRRITDVDRTGPTIIVASAEDDPHSLPIFALEAALAERRVAAHVLGARLPVQSLASIADRLHPRVIFLWASLARSDSHALGEALASAGDETTLILGGPGWPPEVGQQTGLAGAVRSTDLGSTVDHIIGLTAPTTTYPPVT